MTKTNRFLSSILRTAKTTNVDMPWSRGNRRNQCVRKRAEDDTREKIA